MLFCFFVVVVVVIVVDVVVVVVVVDDELFDDKYEDDFFDELDTDDDEIDDMCDCASTSLAEESTDGGRVLDVSLVSSPEGGSNDGEEEMINGWGVGNKLSDNSPESSDRTSRKGISVDPNWHIRRSRRSDVTSDQ